MAMRVKGVGEHHYKAVLTEEIVREARRLHREEHMSRAKIARLLGVNYGTLQQAIDGRTWKNVDGPLPNPYRYKVRGTGLCVSKAGKEKIAELAKAGYKASEITSQMKISDGTVRKYMKEAGFQLRGYRREAPCAAQATASTTTGQC